MEKTAQTEQTIIRALHRRDLRALEWEGEYTHFRRLYALAYRRARLGRAVLWVAEQPSVTLVGQLFVQLVSGRTDLADGQTRAYLHSFRVREAFRGSGIGGRLLEVAEADLVRRGFTLATLNVGRHNAKARRFYERSGYRVVAPEPGCWQYIDHQGLLRSVNEPSWRMQKTIGNG